MLTTLLWVALVAAVAAGAWMEVRRDLRRESLPLWQHETEAHRLARCLVEVRRDD
jgi:cytochrome c-type biogenesis protein CcmH/NrfF